MFDTVFARDVQQTLDHFRRSVDQLFNTLHSGENRTTGSSYQNSQEVVFSPVIESGWNEQELTVRAVVPGVPEKDLRVHLQGNRLVIEGERRAPENWTKASHTELAYGKFYASLALPQGLNLEKLSCRLHDGVLDITVPVAEQMKPRQIQIESAGQSKAIGA
jgi:HSP20 family protein